MESQSQSEIASAGDGIKEAKDKNGNCFENKDIKKSTKEKDLKEKIKQYLECTNDNTQSENRKYEKANKSEEIKNVQTFSEKPCNYFNDFGTCKYKSGHISKSGDTSLIHICRFCHGSYGKRNAHPESLCAQLKSHGDLLDHGKPLQLDDLNTEVLEKGTDEELGKEISKKLQEPKVEMIVGVVGVIGREAAADTFKKTKKVESEGGMMIRNGARRRTAGGTFLQLMRENPHIDQERVASFFDIFNGVQIGQMPINAIEMKETISQVEPMVQPCDYFNDVGSCKFKAGHLSKSGLTSRLHICRVCFVRNGEKNIHSETNCHLNPNTSLKTPASMNLNTSLKPPAYMNPNTLLKTPASMNPNTSLKSPASMINSFNYAGARPKFENQGSIIRHQSSLANLSISPQKFHYATGANSLPVMPRQMSQRMDEIADKSTPRSRLLQASQARGIFGKADKIIGNSTPKSRLTESMGNYMTNVGSKRNGSTNDEKFSMGRNRQNTQDRGYESRKDQKLDSMKDSISQIIGCLNQQKKDVPKMKNYVENRLATDKSLEKATGFQEKSVHNFGDNNPASKSMANLKMEGIGEKRMKQEIAGKKVVKGKHGLNPSASPFSPTVAPFNPSTPPPPFLGFPLKLKTTPPPTFPKDRSQDLKLNVANVKGSSKKLSRGKGASAGLNQNEKKTGNVLMDQDKELKRSSSLKKEEKSDMGEMERGKGKSGNGEIGKEKGKMHCVCPPFCPDCLENISRKK